MFKIIIINSTYFTGNKVQFVDIFCIIVTKNFGPLHKNCIGRWGIVVYGVILGKVATRHTTNSKHKASQNKKESYNKSK